MSSNAETMKKLIDLVLLNSKQINELYAADKEKGDVILDVLKHHFPNMYGKANSVKDVVNIYKSLHQLAAAAHQFDLAESAVRQATKGKE